MVGFYERKGTLRRIPILNTAPLIISVMAVVSNLFFGFYTLLALGKGTGISVCGENL
jgi:hypothetical protein